MRPNRSTAACAAACASSKLVMSSLVTSRFSAGPSRVFSTSSGRRPVATTWWPAANAWRAMSVPRPRPAPVTKMTLLMRGSFQVP
jgi:hypothetical protein